MKSPDLDLTNTQGSNVMSPMEDSGGGDSGGGASGGIESVPVIIDGLLCNVARAISRKASLEELCEAIMRDCEKEEITNSWTMLFTHFKDVWCKQRNKPVVEIVRTELRIMVKDIIDQLVVIDTSGENMKLLCMPWYYTIKNFETDSENRANVMVEEAVNSVDKKIDAMEKRIDRKNQEMFASLRSMVELVINKPDHVQSTRASYAGVAAGTGQQLAGHVRGWGQQTGGVAPVQVGGSQPKSGARAAQGSLQLPTIPIRSRSPSFKRVKLDDGSTHEVMQDRDSSGPRPNNKKAVTGTSNASVTGRKMRSPPADIFIYGVHPDTREEDIVTDLSESGIEIETTDIIKKSKDDAPLKSFKISVKAEDLQKALDPSVWPMRVKVREYIYYSKKSAGQAGGVYQQQGGHTGQMHGYGRGQHVPGGVRVRGEQVLGEVEGQLVPGEVEGHQVHGGGGVQSLVQMWQGAPTENRFAVLAKTSANLAEQEL